MKEEEKILRGILFSPADPELKAIKRRAHNLSFDFSRTYENEEDRRGVILAELLGELGEGSFMQGPIFFHYGVHTRIGKRFFANYNLTVQDDAIVTIGDDCCFGPNVTIVTPLHPMLPNERNAMADSEGDTKRLCYAKPVNIGNSCWLGANVVVCPGVTIGTGCVIGAGSVVLRDVPPDSFAAGNPCKVIREITNRDSMEYKYEILGRSSVLPLAQDESDT